MSFRRGTPTPDPMRGMEDNTTFGTGPVPRSSRFSKLVRFRGESSIGEEETHPMRPELAMGHYTVVENDIEEPPHVDTTSGRRMVFLDESQEPSMKRTSSSKSFGIGGLITDDPSSADEFGHSLPEYIIPGDIDPNDPSLVQRNPGLRERNPVVSEYKYSSLRRYCRDELGDVVSKLFREVEGEYVAKIIRKKPTIPETLVGFATKETPVRRIHLPRLFANPMFPSSHDVYAATLKELMDEITEMYPNMTFELYLDPNTMMDMYRLIDLCGQYPSIIPMSVTEDVENGALMVADLIIGASMEQVRTDPPEDIDTYGMLRPRMKNTKAVLGKKSQ